MAGTSPQQDTKQHVGAGASDLPAASTAPAATGATQAAAVSAAPGASAAPATPVKIPSRIAHILMNSLKGGVVPRVGLPYITVGRTREIEAMLRDLELVADGGASFRFVCGRYGSGKSFLLQTIRNHAMGKNFVVADADLSPERRLHGSKGQGLATYRELIANLATRTRPEGGALTLILDRWISALQQQVAAGGVQPGDPAFLPAVEQQIRQAVSNLHDMVHGFDFAQLMCRYFHARQTGDDSSAGKVLKWFRGEYQSRREVREDLGVNMYISDDGWYEHIKLFAQFFKGAGYTGLVIFVDELVNLYKIPNAIARQYNYEKLLTMYNDALQGKAHHLGIVMSGTPESVEDRRRGLYSYEALRSRLTQGRFAGGGYTDLFAPIIHLEPLTHEELLVLIEKTADIHAGMLGYPRSLDMDDLIAFLRIELSRVGAQSHITPREIARDFIELLDILYQNPGLDLQQLLASGEFGQTGGTIGPGGSPGPGNSPGPGSSPGIDLRVEADNTQGAGRAPVSSSGSDPGSPAAGPGYAEFSL